MDTDKINEEKIKKLQTHIDALQTSYNNMISILNQNVEKDDNDQIKLKDTQKRIFAQGTMEVAESADKLLSMIETQTIKLNSLKDGIDLDKEPDPEKPKENLNKEPETSSKNDEEYPLEKHLN